MYAAEGRGRRRRWRLTEMLLLTATLPQSKLHHHGETYAGYERQPAAEADIKSAPGLYDLNQQGARRIIQQAIEAELANLSRRLYDNKRRNAEALAVAILPLQLARFDSNCIAALKR